jgi:hypothetical protein
MFKSIKSKVAVLGAAAAVMTTQASAALTAPTFAADDAVTIGTAVISGLALIWAIKKAMALAK